MATEDNKGQQNAVLLKLPIFWTSQPQVWFGQAEAQFHIRWITADTTKYYYVVSALEDQETALITSVSHQPTASTRRSKGLLTTQFVSVDVP